MTAITSRDTAYADRDAAEARAADAERDAAEARGFLALYQTHKTKQFDCYGRLKED